jgi:integrase
MFRLLKQLQQLLTIVQEDTIKGVDKGTFHDIRKTAITNWFRQGLSEYNVMTLAGHSDFETTHRFYLAVADDLVARARQAITHRVNPKLLEKCCRRNLKGVGT